MNPRPRPFTLFREYRWTFGTIYALLGVLAIATTVFAIQQRSNTERIDALIEQNQVLQHAQAVQQSAVNQFLGDFVAQADARCKLEVADAQKEGIPVPSPFPCDVAPPAIPTVAPPPTPCSAPHPSASATHAPPRPTTPPASAAPTAATTPAPPQPTPICVDDITCVSLRPHLAAC